ncbi:MAG: hypothetical protein FJY20_06065 [Bacteroidetes bacterium]|nr:hypothetical protein [Bacteroidota bacterium]
MEIRVMRFLHQGKTGKGISAEVDLMPGTVEAIIDKLKTRTSARSINALVEFAVDNKIVESL